MSRVKMKGLEEIRAKVRRLQQPLRMQPTLKSLAEDLQGWIDDYPPIDNTGKRSWWERGKGWWWRRKDGSLGQNNISEKMNTKWSTIVKGLRATVSNNASYVEQVHSAKSQKRIHAARGWRTDKQAIETKREYIVNTLARKIDELLR